MLTVSRSRKNGCRKCNSWARRALSEGEVAGATDSITCLERFRLGRPFSDARTLVSHRGSRWRLSFQIPFAHGFAECASRFGLKSSQKGAAEYAHRLTENHASNSQKMAVAVRGPKIEIVPRGKWSRIQLCFESVVRKPRQVFLALNSYS